jgi:hypothetical protein
MTVRHVVVVALSGWLCLAINPRLLADNQHESHDVPVGLLKAVQDATRGFFGRERRDRRGIRFRWAVA